jgi:hypothetical protein
MKIQSLYFIVFSLLLSACATIKPDAPAVLTQEAMRATHLTDNRIVVPIEIDMTKFIKEADRKIPAVIKGGDQPCSGVRYEYEFFKDQFNVHANQQTLTTTLLGSYWIKMNYCAACSKLFGKEDKCISPVIPFSCGVNEERPSVNIQLTTQVGVNKQYGVSSVTKIQAIEPINPCKVTLFKFDATKAVMKRVTAVVEEEAANMDKELESISFKKEAELFWKQLNTSYSIPNLGYLHVEPRSVAIVKPTFLNNKLYTSLVLNCSTLLNQQAEHGSKKELPELKVISAVEKDTFSVVTDIELSYDSLSYVLTQQLKDQVVNLKGNQFVFKNFEVKGLLNNKISLAVHFEGSKKGVLYLKGVPTFDNATKTFRLDELDYELETKSAILKLADWLYSKRITEELQKASTISFQQEVTDLIQTVHKNINRKIGDYQLRGTIVQASVNQIQTSLEHLYLQTKVDAQLKVTD